MYQEVGRRDEMTKPLARRTIRATLMLMSSSMA
jgi:hypothetical protein